MADIRNRQWVRRLYSVYLKSGDIVPEQALDQTRKKSISRIFEQLVNLVKMLFSESYDSETMNALLSELFVVSKFYGHDAETELDAYVRRREAQRSSLYEEPRAPTIEELS